MFSPIYDHAYFTTEVIAPLSARYPEIFWFADPRVAITKEQTGKISKTGWTQLLLAKGLVPINLRISYQAEGKYIELERMLSSLQFFYIFHQGDAKAYDAFTCQQKPEQRLTKHAFEKLHLLARKVAYNDIQFETVLAALIYSDLGKTPNAQTRFKLSVRDRPKTDHDDFMSAVLQLPYQTIAQILPSHAQLKPAIQNQLSTTSKAMSIHLGHALHQEGGERMFSAFKMAAQAHDISQEVFDRACLIHFCDVAAAQAHLNYEGSTALIQASFEAYEMLMDCLADIRSGQSIQEAFDTYQIKRAARLGLKIETGEGANKVRIISRLACLMRLYTPAAGRALRDAYERLPERQRALIEGQFDPKQGFNQWARNPTYLPTVLLNLGRFADYDRPTALELQRALQGAVCLAYLFEEQQALFATSDNPLNLNRLAGQATEHPELFVLDTFKKALAQEYFTLDAQSQFQLKPEAYAEPQCDEKNESQAANGRFKP